VLIPEAALVVFESAVATPVPKPLIPVETGKPVAFVKVPLDGVPNSPFNVIIDPADPTSTESADATFAPRPLTPVEIGRPTVLVKVPEAGVPRIGVTNVGDVALTTLPEPVVVNSPNMPLLLYSILPFVPEVIEVVPIVKPLIPQVAP